MPYWYTWVTGLYLKYWMSAFWHRRKHARYRFSVCIRSRDNSFEGLCKHSRNFCVYTDIAWIYLSDVVWCWLQLRARRRADLGEDQSAAANHPHGAHRALVQPRQRTLSGTCTARSNATYHTVTNHVTNGNSTRICVLGHVHSTGIYKKPK